MSAIEWTDKTWNPVVGCSPVSEGCRHCFAAREAIRLAGNPNPKVSLPYVGTSEMRGMGKKRRAVFTGKLSLMHDRLEQPLRWRKPRRVFVNSMSDLFHEDVPVEFIAQVFAVMELASTHTFQVLTKRPLRMTSVLAGRAFVGMVDDARVAVSRRAGRGHPPDFVWPLPNVWLGTSVEDQEAANDRIPHLLRTPAAVRFLSCEPLIGSVDLTRVSLGECDAVFHDYPHINRARFTINAVRGVESFRWPAVDWVIAGGESGPGARACNVEWIRSIVAQCREAGAPVFVKQLGTVPVEAIPGKEDTRAANAPFMGGGWSHWQLRDRKGGDPEEWPEDLRVREFPAAIGCES